MSTTPPTIYANTRGVQRALEIANIVSSGGRREIAAKIPRTPRATESDAADIVTLVYAVTKKLAAFDDGIPRMFLQYAITHVMNKLSASSVANGMRISRRTLYRAFFNAALPSPHDFVRCMRIASALLLLEKGRTVAYVARAMNFAGAAALRNMIRRETGKPPSDLRGGYKAELEVILEALDGAHAYKDIVKKQAEKRRNKSTKTDHLEGDTV
jgi:transcriptional regulator GlxA family with amidase domain